MTSTPALSSNLSVLPHLRKYQTSATSSGRNSRPNDSSVTRENEHVASARGAGRMIRYLRALDANGQPRFFQSVDYLKEHFRTSERTIQRWRAELIASGDLVMVSARGHRGKFPVFELTPRGRRPCWPRSSNAAQPVKNPAHRGAKCHPEMSPISPSGSIELRVGEAIQHHSPLVNDAARCAEGGQTGEGDGSPGT